MKKILALVFPMLILVGCGSKSELKNEEKRFVDPATIQQAAQPFKPWIIEDSSKINFTENGVGVYIVQEGPGNKPKPGQYISVHYHGMLEDGTKFDSSFDTGKPITFPFGGQKVIPGWIDGIRNLKFGTKAILIIPPQMAYGEPGLPPSIPPNATLIFDIELVGSF